MHGVDLSPLYGQLNELLLIVGAGLITWVTGEVRAWLTSRKLLNAQIDNELANGLNRALQNGMQIGLNQMNAWETAHKDVEVQGALQRFAASYAIEHSPDALKRFGLSPEQLATKALAYLPPPPVVTAGGIILGKPTPQAATPEAERAQTADLNRSQSNG